MTSREHLLQEEDMNDSTGNRTFNEGDVSLPMNNVTTSVPSSLLVGIPTTSIGSMGTQLQTQAGLSVRAAGSATITVTETPAMASVQDEILQLSLRGMPRVTWDEATLDNEGLGRKSSKRCCIFHKQRAFDESSTDSSEYDSDHGSISSDGGDGDRKMPAANSKKSGGNNKIARRKKGTRKIPDSQRFHA